MLARYKSRRGSSSNGELALIVLLLAALWFASKGGGILPIPTPPPIPGEGLRVLIVEETADRGKLPRAQAEILTSTLVRGYLIAKCAKSPDGKTPEFRILDDDLTPDLLKFERPAFVSALARAIQDSAGHRPWLVVSNGSTGVSQPLPADVDATLSVLRKYGGD